MSEGQQHHLNKPMKSAEQKAREEERAAAREKNRRTSGIPTPPANATRVRSGTQPMTSKPSPTVVTSTDDPPAKVVVGTGGRGQSQKGMFGFAYDYHSKATIKATQLATSVPMGTSIQEAAKCMLTTGQDTVLITDENSRLKGILTDTDIVKKVVSEGKNPESAIVEDFMTPNPQTIPSGTLCVDALKLMVENKFRHIPVVRPDGTLDGITDLPRCLATLKIPSWRHRKQWMFSLDCSRQVAMMMMSVVHLLILCCTK
jgi:predicted transcriptional regulator